MYQTQAQEPDIPQIVWNTYGRELSLRNSRVFSLPTSPELLKDVINSIQYLNETVETGPPKGRTGSRRRGHLKMCECKCRLNVTIIYIYIYIYINIYVL
jgi:hypothetical protein